MKSLFITFLALFALAAHAGGGGGPAAPSIVYDPTNHAENLVTAARSVYAEAQRATQIYNQLTQYQHMLMQAKGMDPTVLNGLLNQNAQDMRSMQSYLGSMGTLINDTERLKEMALNRSVDWSRSGLTFEGYAKREAERIDAGDRQRAQLAINETTMMRQVNRDVEFMQRMQENIPGATANQASELMNSALARVVAQNATLIQLQASNAANTHLEAARAKESKADQERLAQEASAKSRAVVDQEIERLRAATAAFRRGQK